MQEKLQEYKITFNVETGYISRIEKKKDGISLRISQKYFFYDGPESGVYIMRMNGETFIPPSTINIGMKVVKIKK